MLYKIYPMLLFFFSFLGTEEVKPTNEVKPAAVVVAKAETTLTAAEKAEALYNTIDANNFTMPQLESFTIALEGFQNLQQQGKVTKNILTLIDFSLSSNTKRLWIIDMTTNTILQNSLVAHGRNTGDEFANNFSNLPESFKSSLGFYATGEVYQGKHGLSMRLDGLDKGMNDNARARAVVMHGADYVAESFIKNHSRLGRSLGCPAIPNGLTKEIISLIKDKSCLYIYHPSLKKKTVKAA